MSDPVDDRPRRGVLLLITPPFVVYVVLSAVMFWGDWTVGRVIVQTAMTLMALGLMVAMLSPRRGAWGVRLVAFVIFASYLAYLINEFLVEEDSLTLCVRQSESSPYMAVAGFLFFGMPCLIYSLWGSTWGNAKRRESGRPTPGEVRLHCLAWGAHWIGSLMAVTATVAILMPICQ